MSPVWSTTLLLLSPHSLGCLNLCPLGVLLSHSLHLSGFRSLEGCQTHSHYYVPQVSSPNSAVIAISKEVLTYSFLVNRIKSLLRVL